MYGFFSIVLYSDLKHEEIVGFLTHSGFFISLYIYIGEDMRENYLCPELRKQSSQVSLIDFPTIPTVIFLSYCPILCSRSQQWSNSTATQDQSLPFHKKGDVCAYTCGTLDFSFFAFSADRKQPLGVAEKEWTLSFSLFPSFSSVLAGSALSQLAQEN